MSRRIMWGACAAALAVMTGCGPTILERRIIEQPDPALLRPEPTPEEKSGEVPPLEDMRPALTLVPPGHDAPKPPDDPRPVALRDAPKTAPPLPPPPAAPASSAAPVDERRDAPPPEEAEELDAEEAEEADAEEGDRAIRRGGVRVNPR